jgi:hypothetical protein
MSNIPKPDITPDKKSKESPGKNGNITNPVSEKIIINIIRKKYLSYRFINSNKN